jgi:hypothetical protein
MLRFTRGTPRCLWSSAASLRCLSSGKEIKRAKKVKSAGVGKSGVGQEWAGHGQSSWDSDTQTFHAGQDWMKVRWARSLPVFYKNP